MPRDVARQFCVNPSARIGGIKWLSQRVGWFDSPALEHGYVYFAFPTCYSVWIAAATTCRPGIIKSGYATCKALRIDIQ